VSQSIKYRPIPRTSSGLELPRGVDYRTKPGRRFRDLYEARAAEAGSPLSEDDKATIRQRVALQIEEERTQSAIARGERVDSGELVGLSGTSKRLSQLMAGRIAGKRDPQDELQDYLDETYGTEPEATAEADAVEPITVDAAPEVVETP
jgi:hypothetical protein